MSKKVRMTYFYLSFRFNKNLITFGLSVATHGYCASKSMQRLGLPGFEKKIVPVNCKPAIPWGIEQIQLSLQKRKYTHAASKSHAAMVVLLNAHPKMSPLLYTCYNYDLHDGYDRNVVMVQEK
jgi:hypothetical protein